MREVGQLERSNAMFYKQVLTNLLISFPLLSLVFSAFASNVVMNCDWIRLVVCMAGKVGLHAWSRELTIYNDDIPSMLATVWQRECECACVPRFGRDGHDSNVTGPSICQVRELSWFPRHACDVVT